MENAGEGADYAAPVFSGNDRNILLWSSRKLFPWFGPIGNPYTPTPLGGIPDQDAATAQGLL